jgi:2-methylcitrate dehydratase PrpD
MDYMTNIKMRDDITIKLASFVSDLKYEKLSLNVIQKTKETIIDFIAALLAGCHWDSVLSQKLIELIISNGGSQEATIIGHGIKVPVVNAAMCNSVLSHVVELDDGHRVARGHPGTVVVSPALAMSEYLHSNGRELITAIVAGYDVLIRVASSMNPSHLERGFHTTGTCGTLAAAAVAAKLYKLNDEETANALGLAGTQAAGLLEVTIDGQMAKPLHPGKSAYAGVLSAMMAKNGVQGPKTIIEGAKGFARAMSDECDYELMLKDLNKVFHISDCYIKPYPSCRHTHPPVDAAISLLKESKFDNDDIKNILIRTYPAAISHTGKIFKPKTPEEAKFSIPYCVCAALVKGKFGLNELEVDCLNNELINILSDKVIIEPDQNLESKSPKTRGAEVSIIFKNGDKLFKRIGLPKGEVENPVSIDDLINKFAYCTDYLYSKAKRDNIINEIFSIDQTNDVSGFISIL